MSDLAFSADERVTAPNMSELLPDNLNLISGDANATHAIIFVGGIHETYHYFDSWADSMKSDANLVVGFDHSQETSTMTVGAHELADNIRELHDNGITDITIVSHSMGGLVAKGAIDELSRTGEAAEFHTIDLHALGAPWGGWAMADPVNFTPGGEAASTLFGFPMASEMGPHSPYLTSLAQEMPPNGELHIYRGDKDEISTPEVSSTQNRYDSIEARATSVVEIQGFGHDDYINAPPELLEVSNGKAMHGYETVETREGSGPEHILAKSDSAGFGNAEAPGSKEARAEKEAPAAAEMSMGG